MVILVKTISIAIANFASLECALLKVLVKNMSAVIQILIVLQIYIAHFLIMDFVLLLAGILRVVSRMGFKH